MFISTGQSNGDQEEVEHTILTSETFDEMPHKLAEKDFDLCEEHIVFIRVSFQVRPCAVQVVQVML